MYDLELFVFLGKQAATVEMERVCSLTESKMTVEATQRRRKNVYRGTMSVEQAQEKLKRLVTKLDLSKVKLSSTTSKASSVVGAQITFTFGNAAVERVCETQTTYEANVACLILWLEDRARNMERGIETFQEAFADSMALAVISSETATTEKRAKHSAYTGSRTIEQSIELFRSSFERLGISESDVKLAWNGEENWARLRMRLPSGSMVEKSSKLQPNHIANVAALGLWLQSRTKNWERGIENMNLDRVFAGNLLPARVD